MSWAFAVMSGLGDLGQRSQGIDLFSPEGVSTRRESFHESGDAHATAQRHNHDRADPKAKAGFTVDARVGCGIVAHEDGRAAQTLA
jgi:hypothetical protein